jgi:hypothetical protein
MLFIVALIILTIFTPLWVERRRVPERSVLGALERELGRHARFAIQLVQFLLVLLVIIILLKFLFALGVLFGL